MEVAPDCRQSWEVYWASQVEAREASWVTVGLSHTRPRLGFPSRLGLPCRRTMRTAVLVAVLACVALWTPVAHAAYCHGYVPGVKWLVVWRECVR